MRKIVILGASSKTGEALFRLLSEDSSNSLTAFTRIAEFEDLFPGAEIFPVSPFEYDKFKKIIFRIQPDVIVNTIGLSGIVPCERSRITAWELNVSAVENIVKAAKFIDAKVIHISTDKVFNGLKGPYTEAHKPSPSTYFGKTKLASENVLISNIKNFAIIRVSQIFGKSTFNQPDIVAELINRNKSCEEISLSAEDNLNPVHSFDLACIIEKIIIRNKTGIYHAGSSDIPSRLDFVKLIAEVFHLNDLKIKKRRKSKKDLPMNYGLVNLKTETDIGYKMPEVRESLITYKHIADDNKTIIF